MLPILGTHGLRAAEVRRYHLQGHEAIILGNDAQAIGCR